MSSEFNKNQDNSHPLSAEFGLLFDLLLSKVSNNHIYETQISTDGDKEDSRTGEKET